jgi:hypothetical protein
MTVVLLGLIVGVGVAAAVVPFFLPWGSRLRFVLSSMAAEPWTAVGASATALGMRAVVVTRVDGGPGWFCATAVSAQAPAREYEVVGTGPLASVAQLHRWMVTGTPLLLVAGPHGDTSLHGPKQAVDGLWIPETVALGATSGAERRPSVGHRHD